MALTLVSTVTVGSGGAASIEFTNIPQTGKDLLVVFSGRRSDTGAQTDWTFNNISTLQYAYLRLMGFGNSVGTFGQADGNIGWAGAVQSDYTANTFSNVSFYVSNYTAAAHKSVSVDSVLENNATATNLTLLAGIWQNTAALTSLKITAPLVQHSTASLYIIS